MQLHTIVFFGMQYKYKNKNKYKNKYKGRRYSSSSSVISSC